MQGSCPRKRLTAAKTQVQNCPALAENCSSMTLPQSRVNYKAAELNPSLANGFWTRNLRFKYPSTSRPPLAQQRSLLL